MFETFNFRRALPAISSLKNAIDEYHNLPKYKDLAAKYGVIAFELEKVDEVAAEDSPTYSPQQKRAYFFASQSIEKALEFHQAETQTEQDQIRKECRNTNKFQAIDGPPGTGKTFVQHQLVKFALREGGRVLYMHVTANAANRAREIFGAAVDVDTFAAVLGDGSNYMANALALAPYTLVLVELIATFGKS